MNTTYAYEPNRDVKTVVDNAVSGNTVSKYSYDYDELGRRQNRVQEGSAFAQDSFDDFEYNPRSEVTGSERFAGTDPGDQSNPLTGLDYAFQYDNIGNRISFTENSDLTEYVANELNQYSQIDDGSTLEPTHDPDGNLTFDGQFNYSWNGENRLVQVTSAVVTEGAKRLTFWYDHQGRRFQKRVEEYQSGSWNEIELTRFLYDDWNLIAEYDATNGSNTLENTYTWGLDLSLTPQGAGGVGGLLSMTEESSSETYYYSFDANGNVTQLVDESGNLAAHYEYSPFGQLVASTGPMADDNPFRFSTKYQDEATGLLYYGFRYYDPEMGRWLSRDPIKERGGLNVYGFIKNKSLNDSDLLGMFPGYKDCKETGKVDKGTWELVSFIPKGGNQAPSAVVTSQATCIYTREEKIEYDCKCDCGDESEKKTRKKTFRHTEDVKHVDVWAKGIPGPWPARTIEDAITSIIGGEIVPPTPGNSDQLKRKCESAKPSSDTEGSLEDDSGTPEIWCWW